MVDTRKLLFGLENYQKRLQQHLAQLQKEYQQLERRWHVFRDVYAGDAADQFKPGWELTSRGFSEYLLETQQIRNILTDRIESLRKVNQKESDLPS